MNIYTRREKPIRRYDDFNKKYVSDWEDKHIGKRYAAGIWCWDCRVPMYDESHPEMVGGFPHPKPLDKCPSCGKSKEETKYNPAMRELGFDKNKPYKPTGIDGASGFIWNIDNHFGVGTSKEEILDTIKDMKWLVDEYGRKMTVKQFHEMMLQVIEEKYSQGEFS